MEYFDRHCSVRKERVGDGYRNSNRLNAITPIPATIP